MGISFLQAQVVRDGSIDHARLTEHIVVGNPLLGAVIPSGADPTSPLGATLLNGLVTRQASMISYDTVFAWMAVATLSLIPLLLTMRAAQPVRAPLQEAHGE
jgi:hypothetical protein